MGLLVAISICHTICWRTTVLQPTFTVLRCLAFALLKVQFQNFSTLQSQQSPLLLWRVVPLLRGVHSCWVYQAKAETELNSFLNQNLVPQSCLQWVDSKDKISNAIKKKKKAHRKLIPLVISQTLIIDFHSLLLELIMLCLGQLNIAWLNCLLYSLLTRLSCKRLCLQREGYKKCLGKTLQQQFLLLLP